VGEAGFEGVQFLFKVCDVDALTSASSENYA
jgi:hypothetical protein